MKHQNDTYSQKAAASNAD